MTSETVVAGGSCSGANGLTYQAAYDADGNATTLLYPNAMVASTTYDPAGEATQLAYTYAASGGNLGVNSGYASDVMTFAQGDNPFAQVATASSPESSQVYSYDGAGRLVGVGDNFEGACTTRSYTLDADSNRTAFTSAATTPVGGACPTTTTASANQTSSFDTNASGQGGSDRIISSTWATSSGNVTGSYAYDVLGRQTSIPGVDTQAGGSSSSPDNLSASYRSDDLVATMSQGAACEGFTYDPSGDVVSTSSYASSCTGTPTTTSTNDYAGSSAPAWTTTTVGSTTSTTAYFAAITQGDALNVTLASSGGSSCLGITTATCTMNLTDLRGNVIATASLTSDTSVTGYSESTEFGLPRSASTESTVAPVYGWLGTHEKAANNLSGLVVMGVRIYNPVTGLFTSPDPVYQGNANPYVYPSDPVNGMDLSGEAGGGPILEYYGRKNPCSIAVAESGTCGGDPFSFVARHWKGLVTGLELVSAGACIVVTEGSCAPLVAWGSFTADTVVNIISVKERVWTPKFWTDELLSAGQSIVLSIPGSFVERGMLKTDTLWIRIVGRGTGAAPAIVDEWATHR